MNDNKKNSSMNKKKKVTIIASLCAAVAILFVGALALFTSRDESDFKSTAGTVVINVNNLFLTNSTNINPGDNDPDNPEGASEGTPHTFSYTVSNSGNKSVRTRQTILLSADKAGDATDALDASTLRLWVKDSIGKELCVDDFDLYPNSSKLNLNNYSGAVASRFFVLSDGTEVATMDEVTAAKEKNSDLIVLAVKYTFLGNVYDGVGVAAETEKADKLEVASTRTQLVKAENGKCEDSYSYEFSMLRGTNNKLQGADIYITVIVEAMQYRNTTDEDWALATSVSRTFSTSGVEGGYVPDTDENKNGSKLTKVPEGFTRTESSQLTEDPDKTTESATTTTESTSTIGEATSTTKTEESSSSTSASEVTSTSEVIVENSSK